MIAVNQNIWNLIKVKTIKWLRPMRNQIRDMPRGKNSEAWPKAFLISHFENRILEALENASFNMKMRKRFFTFFKQLCIEIFLFVLKWFCFFQNAFYDLIVSALVITLYKTFKQEKLDLILEKFLMTFFGVAKWFFCNEFFSFYQEKCSKYKKNPIFQQI